MKEPVNTFALSPEQQDTAALLRRLLGKAITERYIDFCRLAAGAFPLIVSRPMAAHALRELDSTLRHVLEVPMEAKASELPEDAARLDEAQKQLRALGYDAETVQQASKYLKPRFTHKDQIRKIVARLGLDPDGDIATKWASLSDSVGKAHERAFHRSLAVDDEFRARYQQPFDTVIRAVAVALEGRYATLMRRVEEIAAMPNWAAAAAAFATRFPRQCRCNGTSSKLSPPETGCRTWRNKSCSASRQCSRKKSATASATGNGPPEIICNAWQKALIRRPGSAWPKR